MTITIHRSVGAIERSPDSIVIQVQAASDEDAAARALALAADDISVMANAKFVSPVARTGSGPVILLDAVDSPRLILRRIPETIVARLEEAGVVDATVACPAPGGPLLRMQEAAGPGLPKAVTLVLYSRPPAGFAEWQGPPQRVPDAWLAEATAWLGAASADDELHGRMLSVEFPVRLTDAEAMLRQTADARNGLELAGGVLGQRMRQATLHGLYLPRLALCAGGPAHTDEELVGLAEGLIDIARRLAGEVAYAVVSVDPAFMHWPESDWGTNHGGEQVDVVEALCDEYVIDAFAYQVLGPGHLARCDGIPAGSEVLSDGRRGLPVGEIADWLLDPPEDRYRNYPSDFNLCGRRRDPDAPWLGRRLLAPCLLRAGEGWPLVAARHRP